MYIGMGTHDWELVDASQADRELAHRRRVGNHEGFRSEGCRNRQIGGPAYLSSRSTCGFSMHLNAESLPNTVEANGS